MWAAPMFTPSSRPFRPITASMTDLPRFTRYTLSPAFRSMHRLYSRKPAASARATARSTHSRSVLPASKNCL